MLLRVLRGTRFSRFLGTFVGYVEFVEYMEYLYMECKAINTITTKTNTNNSSVVFMVIVTTFNFFFRKNDVLGLPLLPRDEKIATGSLCVFGSGRSKSELRRDTSVFVACKNDFDKYLLQN